ncbi:DUF3822 family protein [Christiangramia salexigens]|uniref:DUF3822 domain-containing protein n=1 Tax=Christiangramia salexigens TaxID=1913577 RepID=A0A1L3J2S3_9FLAO|nr:DUF3822 family protein [Christiangramia salexigens]APG59420.1 hypothetical protein LPB144_02910 [Christiangramia salexigens]
MVTNKIKNSNMKLSIQVSLNGLSFCILDQNEDRISFFKKVDFKNPLNPIKVLAKIEEEYEKEEALSQDIHEVTLLFRNSLFSLVPLELFDEEKASDYLKFNAKILKTDFIAFDKLDQEMVNVYVPYANITNYFFDKYGEFEYRHSLSVLVETLMKHSPKQEKPLVYLHSLDGSFELVIIENSKLLLANSFDYDTKEDFLYYLLFTAEQLELDPNELELILLGDISKESDEYKLTWDYIKNVSFLGPFHSFKFDTSNFPENEHSEYLLLKSF